MKKANKIIFIFVILIIVLFDFIFIFSKKGNYSYLENRYLKKFAISNINEYISDHFPSRNRLLSIKTKADLLSGKTYINDTYICKDNYLIPKFINNPKSHYIYETINDFSKDKNVYVMFVPDSILVNEDKMYYHLDIEEDNELDNLYKNLKYSTNIDLRDVLIENNKEEQMYYRTDHHWTTFGAYYAYVEFMKTKNEEYLNREDFNIEKVSSEFMGTTSSKVLGVNIVDDIYTFNTNNDLEVNYVDKNVITDTLYNEKYLSEKDKYAYFLDNNHSEIIIHNKNLTNNKKILVVKNSYANSFIPFLTNHYEYIYVIDMRYFNNNVSDYIENNNIEETLILYNMYNLYMDMSIVKME
ncbi:MAG: hypothetical protein IKE89_00615 [Bacilli bacterium]|nr:hypothetical protein [Bacilli bacterium]